MTAAPLTFTAAQVADALACTPQAVRQHLEGVPGQTTLADNSRAALAWPMEALPAPIQADLETAATARGYRSALHLLQNPAPAWQPRAPLSEIAPQWIERAVKLRAALAPALARLDDPAVGRQSGATAAESEKLALDEYRRQFGHTITPRHLRRLLERTLQRDAGARAWHRLELYLDNAAGRPAAASRASIITREVHKPLADALETLENKLHPSADDRAFLFHEAFTHFENLLADAPDKSARRLLKTSLIDYLFSAIPGLSKTGNLS